MTDRTSLEQLIAIEHLLTDDEKAVRDVVRAWVKERFAPVIAAHHRDGTFPTELIAEFAELGVLGANLQGYGCAGLNNVAYGLIMQELERGDSGLRSFASVQGALVMYPIATFGDEVQRSKWLPPLQQGKLIGCFGLTEPGAGSDPGAMTTTAKKDGNQYILDGVKAWITNAPLADVAVVWAKVADEDSAVRGFVVERDRPGFSSHEVEGKFSLRASSTGEIHLSECRVPAANLLAGSMGLRSPLVCLTQARQGIGWGVTGAALECFDCTLEYGLMRMQFDRPLASFQLFQAQLAEMASQLAASQLLSLHTGRLKDAGRLTPVQVSLHKRHNVRVAREVARNTRGMLGAIGITDAYPVIRHMMNLESVYTYEGTDEIHTLSIGRALTGIDAFGAGPL